MSDVINSSVPCRSHVRGVVLDFRGTMEKRTAEDGKDQRDQRRLEGGPSGRQGPSDATLQGSAWANSSPWPVEEGRWSDQKLGNAHVQGFEKHWRSPGAPLPAYPSPGLHTKHAALLGTQSPKFWLPPGHGAITGTAGSACSVQCVVCSVWAISCCVSIDTSEGAPGRK